MKPILSIVFAFCVLVVAVNHAVVLATDGTAKGESTDEPGQQGLGLKSEGRSSNIIMGGAEIVEGTITKIDGELFSIHGNRGQEISLRVTKDPNKVCGSGQVRVEASDMGTATTIKQVHSSMK